MAKNQKIDIGDIELWSKKEDKSEEFKRFKELLDEHVRDD